MSIFIKQKGSQTLTQLLIEPLLVNKRKCTLLITSGEISSPNTHMEQGAAI